MTSFYAKTPSSFMIECGWGGREIDPATWQPVEMHDGPSLWGHERVWLPPEDRVVAREMRMRAAASGLRAPVQVMEGNYKLMSGTCAWWDGVSGSSSRLTTSSPATRLPEISHFLVAHDIPRGDVCSSPSSTAARWLSARWTDRSPLRRSIFGDDGVLRNLLHHSR